MSVNNNIKMVGHKRKCNKTEKDLYATVLKGNLAIISALKVH